MGLTLSLLLSNVAELARSANYESEELDFEPLVRATASEGGGWGGPKVFTMGQTFCLTATSLVLCSAVFSRAQSLQGDADDVRFP